MAVYCTVGKGRCRGHGRAVSSQLLVHAGQPRLALTFLMLSVSNMHIPGFLTGTFNTAHQSYQHFEVLAFLRLAIVVRRPPLEFRAAPSLKTARNWRSFFPRRALLQRCFPRPLSGGLPSEEPGASSQLGLG